jgi:hypothetical protein
MTSQYDIHTLIEDVAALLLAHGCNPQFSADRAQQRARGASDLLAGLGVVPTLKPENGGVDLDGSLHYDRRIHGD